jgi:hypothetical protein
MDLSLTERRSIVLGDLGAGRAAVLGNGNRFALGSCGAGWRVDFSSSSLALCGRFRQSWGAAYCTPMCNVTGQSLVMVAR